jgi:hypothetical protein
MTLLAPAVARATPTWMSAINLSDAGQDGYAPQVAVDSSGDSLAVWNRSDGSNIRIQAKFRAANGTFSPTETISVAGKDALAPQISFDASGDALAAWYRYDGSNDRIQVAIRPAGGSFGAAETLSPPGFESFNPEIAAGPNVDANGVAVWTGSDGANTRVQTARRRDVVGFPRPRGASPLVVSLVPAFQQCTSASANSVHGPPLAFPSCNPPVQTSTYLTVGTPDANGQAANSVGSVRITAIPGNPSTQANDADIALSASVTDVRCMHLTLCASTIPGAAYQGELDVQASVQITDRDSRGSAIGPSTFSPQDPLIRDPFLHFPASCAQTADPSIGSTCHGATTLNAVVPGAVQEGQRAIWELGQIQVFDGGADGVAEASDAKLFMDQGVFVP